MYRGIGNVNGKVEHITVPGHIGKWYIVCSDTDEDLGEGKDAELFLLEHETYGDTVASVIVDGYGNLVMEDVWNGIDDYWEAKEIMYEG